MKISNIKVKNFRLLRDFNVDLENNLTLIIGKNNTGKTSLLHILQKFIKTNSNCFAFEDISISVQKALISLVEHETLEEDAYEEIAIEMALIIEREETDSLINIKKFLIDLDPDNRTTRLLFRYYLDLASLKKLRADFRQYSIGNSYEFLKKQHGSYFKLLKLVVDREENVLQKVEDKDLARLICLNTISARRDVSNEDGVNPNVSKRLSKLSYRYYKPYENTDNPHVIGLQRKLIEADAEITESYKTLFSKVTKDVERFSYTDSKVAVKSNFQEINLMKDNTSVVYQEDDVDLPEDYNGLGYMNLFAMIFELHIIFDNFKKTHDTDEGPADINLLFIEEPEAHTHPQMQYVFIRKIREFLQDNAADLCLQSVITTHSAHIASQSNFSDIKYFILKGKSVESKNLSDLKNLYSNDSEGKQSYKFLTQYLTLQKAEIFFSDKIIFIEGDTERILLPAMLHKFDKKNESTVGYIPLLSQKISVVEVGAYSKVFEPFLRFLEIRTLVITDIDSVKDNGKGSKVCCKVVEAEGSSNSSIKHFFAGKSWKEIRDIPEAERELSGEGIKIYIAYQEPEEGYHARTFEDCFIALNHDFVKANKQKFNSLKNIEMLEDTSPDYYDLALKCIDKKSEFATEILYYSSIDENDWKTPKYIENGLKWLAQ